jgi:hypothetical protein
LNLYGYVSNEPSNIIDPIGLQGQITAPGAPSAAPPPGSFRFSQCDCQKLRSQLAAYAAKSKKTGVEVGAGFNYVNGHAMFGPTMNGPSATEVDIPAQYPNAAMSHVLAPSYGLIQGFVPSGDYSGFSSKDLMHTAQYNQTTYAVNKDGNIFVLDPTGHEYEITADCKQCWDLGIARTIPPGQKACPQ